MSISKEIIELSKKLISIKSNPGNNKELNKALELIISELDGFNIEIFEKEGTKSIIVYNTETRPDRFRVILNGHLDIIPGKDYQYIPEIKDGKIYGVGSMDMKSNVVCMVKAFKNIAGKLKYPIGLQIVTDEEIGGFNGTMYQIESGIRSDFVIAGETTNFNIVNQARGGYWLKINFHGKTAHGAYPWRGENAILKANKFLGELFSKFPIPENEQLTTTVNLAKIETSNETFNKIPDVCTVWLDIRFTSNKKNTILDEIKILLPDDSIIDIFANEPPLDVSEKNADLQKLKYITQSALGQDIVFYGAQGSSDARHYYRVGDVGIEFGPIGGGIGTDNEWVDIKSLETFYIILNNFLIDLNNDF